MKVYKIEAIKMPKKASGLVSDTYMLLYFAETGQSYLPNGKKITIRGWVSPTHDVRKSFYTKEEFWEILEGQRYIALNTFYQEEGNLTMQRYKILVKEAFKSAKTIEELGEISLSGATFCKTSKDFYAVCTDFYDKHRFDFNRGALNVDNAYVEYAIQPFYVIRLEGGVYLGEKPKNMPTSLSVFKAYQATNEQDALKTSEVYMDILGDYGFEIVKIEAFDKNEIIPILEHLK